VKRKVNANVIIPDDAMRKKKEEILCMRIVGFILEVISNDLNLCRLLKIFMLKGLIEYRHFESGEEQRLSIKKS
jgi:hypothetical protein